MRWTPLSKVDPDIDLWGCRYKGFSYVISRMYNGYRASAKPLEGGETVNLEYHLTFAEAEKACKAHSKWSKDTPRNARRDKK